MLLYHDCRSADAVRTAVIVIVVMTAVIVIVVMTAVIVMTTVRPMPIMI